MFLINNLYLYLISGILDIIADPSGYRVTGISINLLFSGGFVFDKYHRNQYIRLVQFQFSVFSYLSTGRRYTPNIKNRHFPNFLPFYIRLLTQQPSQQSSIVRGRSKVHKSVSSAFPNLHKTNILAEYFAYF